VPPQTSVAYRRTGSGPWSATNGSAKRLVARGDFEGESKAPRRPQERRGGSGSSVPPSGVVLARGRRQRGRGIGVVAAVTDGACVRVAAHRGIRAGDGAVSSRARGSKSRMIVFPAGWAWRGEMLPSTLGVTCGQCRGCGRAYGRAPTSPLENPDTDSGFPHCPQASASLGASPPDPVLSSGLAVCGTALPAPTLHPPPS
jgi:hypothetical protein